jgi:hypothetical protein
MSFSITLANAGFFKKIMEAMAILDEPIMRIEEDRFLVRQLGLMGSAMIHFELPSTTFDQYECSKPDIVKFNRKDLLDCLRRARGEQYIGFAVEEGKEDRLIVTLSEKSIKDFKIPIYAVLEDEEIPPPPVTKARFDDVKLKMDTSSLDDTLTEFGSILSKELDRLDVTATEGHLIFEGKGARRSLTVTHMLGSDILAMEIVPNSVVTAYSVGSLIQIVEGAAKLSGIVLAEFSEYKPIRLTYELPFEGVLQYFLAPMMKVVGEA